MSGMSTGGIEHVKSRSFYCKNLAFLDLHSAEANLSGKMRQWGQWGICLKIEAWGGPRFPEAVQQNDQEKGSVTYKSFMQDTITLRRSSLIRIITVIPWHLAESKYLNLCRVLCSDVITDYSFLYVIIWTVLNKYNHETSLLWIFFWCLRRPLPDDISIGDRCSTFWY